MQNLIHGSLKFLSKFDSVSNILTKTVYKFVRIHKTYRDERSFNILVADFNTKILNIFKDKTVLNGPFKGMHYPEIDSVGSTIYPKLLGCYEHELHPLVNCIIQKKYADLIDIGCAEGYYAVGFALKSPGLTVHAFDIDSKARDLCEKMALLNKVHERVHIHTVCTDQILKDFPYRGPTLIMCDCEGYEIELFNNSNLEALQVHDLLIELHDFVRYEISAKLIKLFSKTHNIQVIRSISDAKKPHLLHYPQLQDFTLSEKYLLLTERRPEEMEWIYCTSKKL